MALRRVLQRAGSLEKWIVLIIVLLGFVLRVWGANFGLPYLYHPDEPNKIAIAQNIFKSGDLNPHYFNKPTLFIYINALAYIPYYLIGKLLGDFSSTGDILSPIMLTMGVGLAPFPSSVLMGRLITVLFATACIPIVFLIGKQVTGKPSVGLFAAFAMATSPTNVVHSRSITENAFMVFFILLVLWCSVRIYQHGRTGDYLLAGIAAGLAVSSKYPAILVLVIPLGAHFLAHGAKALLDYRLVLVFLMTPLAFFATTPYALLDHTKFLQDTLGEVVHYRSGHFGMEGDSFTWYLQYMWQTAGVISLLAALEIVRSIYSRSKEIILLTLFPIIFFLFISSFIVRNDQTLLPITPFLFMLAGSFLAYLFQKVGQIQTKVFPNGYAWGVVGLSVLAILLPTVMTISDTLRLTTVDSRITASHWINYNLPAGARIAIEAYSPFIDPVHFSVSGFTSLIEHPPAWYLENGYEYLVFGQGMYGRFYREPDKYQHEISEYDNLFGSLEPIKFFSDGDYQVRVYKVQH